LIDTGLDSKYGDDSKGVDGVLVRKIAEEYTLNNNGTLFQLEHNQIKPKLIFVSHLHPDHVAGVRELTNIPVVISYKERFTEDKFIILSQYFKDLNELYEIDFSKGNDLEIFGQCADVLGDGSLWAIPTPGHTRGHLSFLVNSTEPVLLTADACFINENLERGVAPSIYTWNKLEAQRSLDRIIRFKNQYPQIRVGVGHEALK
jgi:glyoxylase-like metal-dependent hydrolase (beta-lactamase superfamily II)